MEAPPPESKQRGRVRSEQGGCPPPPSRTELNNRTLVCPTAAQHADPAGNKTTPCIIYLFVIDTGGGAPIRVMPPPGLQIQKAGVTPLPPRESPLISDWVALHLLCTESLDRIVARVSHTSTREWSVVRIKSRMDETLDRIAGESSGRQYHSRWQLVSASGFRLPTFGFRVSWGAGCRVKGVGCRV